MKIKSVITRAFNMKVGQVGIVTGRNYHGEHLLRTYDRIVSLNDPGGTWGTDCTLEVELLPVGTEITLVVTEEEED